MISIGNKKENRWHLQTAQRWVNQYNFYVNDKQWGAECSCGFALTFRFLRACA